MINFAAIDPRFGRILQKNLGREPMFHRDRLQSSSQIPMHRAEVPVHKVYSPGFLYNLSWKRQYYVVRWPITLRQKTKLVVHQRDCEIKALAARPDPLEI